MDDVTLKQARELYETIRQLRVQVMCSATAPPGSARDACMDLTLAQMGTLMVIHARGQVTIKDLAQALHVSPPSASAMVERLVELGAVTRRQSETDRREVLVSISPEAAHTVDEMEGRILQGIIDMFEKLGPRYAQMWCDVYAEIQRVLDQESAAGKRQAAI